jgi:hypothetical protein
VENPRQKRSDAYGLPNPRKKHLIKIKFADFSDPARVNEEAFPVWQASDCKRSGCGLVC